MSTAVKPNRRRRAFAPLTELRAERLRQALTLFEVSQASGICSYRVSLIERALDDQRLRSSPSSTRRSRGWQRSGRH